MSELWTGCPNSEHTILCIIELEARDLDPGALPPKQDPNPDPKPCHGS